MESESFRVGGEFLLHAPCLNLSGRRSGGESILHAPFWHLSLRSIFGESVSIKSGSEVSLTRPVLISVC